MTSSRWTRRAVAGTIDATLLRPEATAADVKALCREAGQLDTYAVCVSPSLVGAARAALRDGLALASVCGFPSGAHRSEVKAAEAAAAVADGATESTWSSTSGVPGPATGAVLRATSGRFGTRRVGWSSR